MKCPNCGNEQSDGWLSCHKCHVIFSRWNNEQGIEAPPTAPNSAPEETHFLPESLTTKPSSVNFAQDTSKIATKSIPIILAILAAICACAGALWWLLNPKGFPVKANAYVDLKNGFALNTSAEWITTTANNFQEVIALLKGGISPILYQQLQSNTVAVAFFRPNVEFYFTPNINIMVIPERMPAITESAKEEFAKSISQNVSTFLTDYQQENIEIVKLDKLKVLHSVYTGSLNPKLVNQGNNSGAALRFEQYLIPGGKQSLILTYTCTRMHYPDLEAEVGQIIDSFRVLKRPTRFNPIVQGGLIGALAGALLYLLKALVKALTKE